MSQETKIEPGFEVVKMHVSNYGKAPRSARRGERVYKVSRCEMDLFKANGWEFVGYGSSYCYMRAPEGFSGKNAFLFATIPTRQKCIDVAMELHRNQEEASLMLGAWKVTYRPAESGVSTYTMFSTVDDTRRVVKEPYSYPAEFKVDGTHSWHVYIRWEKGDNEPPRVVYETDHIVELAPETLAA